MIIVILIKILNRNISIKALFFEHMDLVLAQLNTEYCLFINTDNCLLLYLYKIYKIR